MKKLKKRMIIVLTSILLLLQVFPVYAEDNSDTEWYEMVEEEFNVAEDNIDDLATPYTLYIMNVQTSLAKLSSSKLGLRADVYCTSTVQSITVTFYLQKYNGSTWVNVSSGTPSPTTNVSSTAKQATVSGLSSGTYRAKSITRVVDKYGYAETVTGYSGSLTI